MEPMNAYERRVVHVALQAEPGVTTYSVGEGPSRRVTVAPAASEGTTPEAEHGGE
jgi:spoIIIJ-associated protein